MYSEQKLAEMLADRARRASDIKDCLKKVLETANEFDDEIRYSAQQYWLHRNRDFEFPKAFALLRKMMTDICLIHEQLEVWSVAESDRDMNEKFKDEQHEKRSRGDSPYH